ncbi:MAG: PhzF family phenazine biosynthesis protein [Spirochaetia bacterium]
MKLYQVDSFTDEKFKGNPAAVCILDKPLDGQMMQKIAAEMNLSETAFIESAGSSTFNLRWFTPETEVNLCGHATLAAGHVLFSTGTIPDDGLITFHTKSGELKVSKEGKQIVMNFPQFEVQNTECPEQLKAWLGINPAESYYAEKRYLFVVESVSELKHMTPDFYHLADEPYGFMITAESEKQEADFCSRFFAPFVGINEDPVTGSAHSYLAPFWGKRLKKKRLTGLQISKRGGIVTCELLPDRRIHIKGEAVTVFHGELHL